MPHAHYLIDVLVLLGAALVAVPLFRRLRLGGVLGYLVAGLAVGPHALGLIEEVDAARALAELGVVFLLFAIGLELTWARLKAIGLRTYGLGLAQIGVSAVAIFALARLAGLSNPAALIVGGGLALSSTAIVLQVLGERAQTKTIFGRTVIAILLLQDLAVGPLLILLEVLGRDGGAGLWGALGLAAVKAGVAVTVIVLAGRFLLTPALRLVAGARSPEIFAAAALFIALGTSWVTEQAGLSMAFGAFLAGMVLGETEFRPQIEADIAPFRGILLGLFFMTVGMTIDLRAAADNVGLVLALALGILVLKGAILFVLGRLFRQSLWRSLRLAGMLSQGGEFAFVLFGIAMTVGVLPDATGQPLLVAVALTMAVTPLLITFGMRFITFLESREATSGNDLERVAGALSGHAIIIGFGEVGRIIARLQRAHGQPYVVLDMSPRRVAEGRDVGEPAFYGDATMESVLHAAGAEQARALVIATAHPPTARRIVEVARRHYPHLALLARGGDETTTRELRKEGVREVVCETTESALRLSGALTEVLNEPQPEPARSGT